VYAVYDRARGQDSFIVFCEVYSADATPHPTNKRHKLVTLLKEVEESYRPRIGFEQEYFIMQKNGRPVGWSDDDYSGPLPQGPFYCGVGSDRVAERDFVEDHLSECMHAGISITGVNAEVALGQWEYQIGGPDIIISLVCDQLWVSRYLLLRSAEKKNLNISFEPKPFVNWNGSGMHANFSTQAMREQGGLAVINEACEKLARNIDKHLSVYGKDYKERLTGEHETCRWDQFRYGISDRGASVRVPWDTARQGFGYFEDRRPNSNADPYDVAFVMVDTLCKDE
jgi:glutamine synthetase